MRKSLSYLPLVCATLLCACGSAEEPTDSLTPRYGTVGTTSTTEPVSYTDVPYDFTGATPIADLYQFVSDTRGPNEQVWVGASSEYPFPWTGECDGFGTEIGTVAGLPAEIEGIVTLPPRFLQTSIKFCQGRERFYGSYFIQDSSGGILVLKDSRIADFRMGDRVKIKAISLMYNFGSTSVLAHIDEEVVSRKHDVHTEYIGERDLTNDDIGKTVTIRRKLASDATNYNFSEMCLVPEGDDYSACDPRCIDNDQCLGSVLISLDREIEQRDPLVFKQGDLLEITGPVAESFGLRLLVARAGQISFVEE